MLAWLALPALAPATTPLVQLSPTLYHTEHAVFVIDTTIPWSNPTAAYNALYTPDPTLLTWPNLANYFALTTAHFPGTYFAMIFMANTGSSQVPNWIDHQFKATGIATPGTTSNPPTLQTVDFCRYNQNGGAVGAAFLGVLDHELGHAWAARVFYGSTPGPTALSDGHWAENSTIDCQMSRIYSDDNGVSDLVVRGNPADGFHWQRIDRARHNEFQRLSEAALYLAGLRAEWPTTYLLNNPVYQADTTMGSSSVSTFDHQQIVDTQGARSPDYTTAPKRFKVGFVYIARSLAEVNTVYASIEASAAQFSEAETIDHVGFRDQVPFLCDTAYRGSVDGRLADLDGNPTPTLALSQGYVLSTDGTASLGYTTTVAAGPAPAVTLVPASACATISGGTVQLAGLPDGVHFFTLKAQTLAGKKTFAHFVVEVVRPAGSVTLTAPARDQVAPALGTATFSVAASTSGPGPLTYQWFRIAAGTSTSNPLADSPGVYSGATSATLTVSTTTAMDGDQFYCVVSDGASTATSNFQRDTILRVDPNHAAATSSLCRNTPALLTVHELPPQLLTQPAAGNVAAPNTVAFSVTAAGAPATFGYEHYQWQRLPAGSSTWADLANGGAYTTATTATLNILTTAPMNGDQFRCVVSNTAGTVTSADATLTVGTLPAITTQTVTVPAAGGGTTTLPAFALPAVVNLFAGDAATLAVTVTGTPPFTYAWKKYGVTVPNSNSTSLALASVTAADAGAYTVTVTNAYGSAGSPNVISIANPMALPSFSSQPGPLTAPARGSATFSATLSGTTVLPLGYQWNLNGAPLAGASGTTAVRSLSLPLTDLTATNAGGYSVTVTSTGGYAVNAYNTVFTATRSVASNSALLTVNLLPQAITFASLPDLAFTFASLALSATADSNLTVTYTVVSGPATLSEGRLSFTGTGRVTLRASQAGDSTYAPATAVDRSFNVTANFDSWRQAAFTAGELADSTLSGPNAVYGHDGLPNLVKYALGLAPKTDATTGLPALTSDGTNWLYTFTRPAIITDVTCTVEASTDLVAWSIVGVTLGKIASANGTDTWQAAVSLAAAPSVFLRLKVTQP